MLLQIFQQLRTWGVPIAVAFSLAVTLVPEVACGQGANDLVTICYRNRTVQVPIYLVQRYLDAGAMLGPCPGMESFVDNRTVTMSIAFGTFTPPPGYGPAENLLFASDAISSKAKNDFSLYNDLLGVDGLFESISADPDFPDQFDGHLNTSFALLDNHGFLLYSSGFLGDPKAQLEAAFQQRLDQLIAANPGVQFQAPNSVGAAAFLATKSSSLFGGALIDVPNVGDSTTIMGTANVNYYTGNFTVTAVPEPSTLCLGLLGLPFLAISVKRPSRWSQ